MSEATSIRAQMAELSRLLERTPEENVIDRFTFQARYEELVGELESLSQQPPELEKLTLTFRGVPVRGSSGISADFAAMATKSFSDAFAMVWSALQGQLGKSGPIASRHEAMLMITGTAIGSFGFEMELPPAQGDMLLADTPAGVAVEKFRDLMRLSAEGSDDEILDVAEALHPRAVAAVSKFLADIARSGAWCGISFRDSYFKFKDIDQVQRSADRLRQENVTEFTERHFGVFQGCLPTARTFEFSVSAGGEVIRGKIGKDFEDPDVINREWLQKLVEIEVTAIRVGQAKARYLLARPEQIRPYSEESTSSHANEELRSRD